VIFETGYGPSGLPHIGTFGEVARTAMVRHAFEVLSEGRRNTRLICFSDDMDGLRKVPENVPNREMLQQHLDKPLTSVTRPLQQCAISSFRPSNNARLRRSLDQFGFDYEFYSATESYQAGPVRRNAAQDARGLRQGDGHHFADAGAGAAPNVFTISSHRARHGKVLQVPMLERHPRKGTVVYLDPETGKKVETAVTGGRVKCQWKADWALRWTALGVDYEMCGKDLIDSVTLSSKICRALGGTPPENFIYELFLDQDGGKISKSKGNGLTIEEWLTYASPESLALFMFQKPKAAKRLFFDVIPKAVDEYLTHVARYPQEDQRAKLDNPAWHIHFGRPPRAELPISFALLLNLVAVSNAEAKTTLWGFIRKYSPAATPEKFPVLDQLVGYALAYYRDFVRPQKIYRLASDKERPALAALAQQLAAVPPDAGAEALQNIVYEVGKAHAFEPLRAWFSALYEGAARTVQGPRFGGFIELFGIDNTRALIAKALRGELVGQA
jgi:lysyl-tRNA synthetase class 1